MDFVFNVRYPFSWACEIRWMDRFCYHYWAILSFWQRCGIALSLFSFPNFSQSWRQRKVPAKPVSCVKNGWLSLLSILRAFLHCSCSLFSQPLANRLAGFTITVSPAASVLDSGKFSRRPSLLIPALAGARQTQKQTLIVKINPIWYSDDRFSCRCSFPFHLLLTKEALYALAWRGWFGLESIFQF